jgi:hypothetical protein
MERNQQADEPEREAEHIDDAQRDWEAKESDASVPGAQPDASEEERDAGREESDQLPEEGPAEQVPDDAGGEARDEAERSPGVPEEEERGTGQSQDAEEHGKQ